MKKEINNHAAHLGLTFERLTATLFLPSELSLIEQDAEHFAELVSSRRRWVRVCDLVVPGVTTEEMALCHLLWLQGIGRVVVEDADPYCGALLLRLSLPTAGKRVALS